MNCKFQRTRRFQNQPTCWFLPLGYKEFVDIDAARRWLWTKILLYQACLGMTMKTKTNFQQDMVARTADWLILKKTMDRRRWRAWRLTVWHRSVVTRSLGQILVARADHPGGHLDLRSQLQRLSGSSVQPCPNRYRFLFLEKCVALDY